MKSFLLEVIATLTIVLSRDAGAQPRRAAPTVRIISPATLPSPHCEGHQGSSGSTTCAEGVLAVLHGPVEPNSPVVAEVTDPGVSEAVVTVNGHTHVATVSGGRLEVEVDWVEGNNRVSIAVRSQGRLVRDAVTMFRRRDVPPLRVRASWPWHLTQRAVRILGPAGPLCAEGIHPREATLDCEVNTAGRYRIVVVPASLDEEQYPLRSEPRDPRDLEPSLEELDALGTRLRSATGRERTDILAARRALLDALDAASARVTGPRATTFEVTLHAGSRREQRWVFRAPGPLDGDEREVGSFTLTPAMIAREPTP